jgi:hypothetical protein
MVLWRLDQAHAVGELPGDLRAHALELGGDGEAKLAGILAQKPVPQVCPLPGAGPPGRCGSRAHRLDLLLEEAGDGIRPRAPGGVELAARVLETTPGQHDEGPAHECGK